MSGPTSEANPSPAAVRRLRAASWIRKKCRTVLDEIRDYPATSTFAAIWIVVFLGLVWLQLRDAPTEQWLRMLVLGVGNGHRFGDLRLIDLEHGEVWRLITATFVHYSLIHIALNLLAFYLLGTLIESWYGSSQFILVYGLTGGGGNLISAFIKKYLGSNPYMHSGGGSVVVMGLIGLCAVVGWRSRTEWGGALGRQMFKAMGITVVLGILFPRYIDNWGHAGGALVGFALGPFHRIFLRRYGGPRAWGTGLLTSLAIGACILAQIRSDHAEAPIRAQETRRSELAADEQAYQGLRFALGLFNRLGPQRLRAQIERGAVALDRDSTRVAYRRLRDLAELSASRPLSAAEEQEFRALADGLLAQLRRRLRELRLERPRTKTQLQR